MAAKIKKGDKVVVLAGKDKGRHGEVTKVMPKEGKVLVSGINVHARHTKPTQARPQGGFTVHLTYSAESCDATHKDWLKDRKDGPFDPARHAISEF